MKKHPIISCVSICLAALWLTSCGAVQEPVNSWPKRVLITNDDGIDSPGIKALALAVLVVDRNALDGDRFHRFNAVQLFDPVVLAQERVAIFTAIDQRLGTTGLSQVAIPTLIFRLSG